MKNNIKELFLYLIVGGIATITEWLCFYAFEKMLLHYTVSTIIAYIISTFVNWAAGRILVFKKSEQSVISELVKIYLTSIVGLVLNLLIMFISVEFMRMGEMFSKIIATGIVFFFNYFVRKFLIYK